MVVVVVVVMEAAVVKAGLSWWFTMFVCWLVVAGGGIVGCGASRMDCNFSIAVYQYQTSQQLVCGFWDFKTTSYTNRLYRSPGEAIKEAARQTAQFKWMNCVLPVDNG